MLALCLGGARSVWEELQAAKAMIGDAKHVVVACNFAGIQYEGHLDAWVTLHPERFDEWRADRATRGLNSDYRAFTHKLQRGQIAEELPWRWFGSSGLYTAQAALDRLGCAGAILCGVPMDDNGGHIHWPGQWAHAYHYKQGINEIGPERVALRSMSGWTADLFGYPDRPWLNEFGGVLGVGASTHQVEYLKVRKDGPLMWIEMLRTHCYANPADRRVSTKYLQGERYSVKRDHGDDMVARGHAVERKAPNREEVQPLSERKGVIRAKIA